MQEQAGNGAAQELFSRLYPELRLLAHSRLRKNQPITLLDTTSLVHEAYLRVARAGRMDLDDRSRFRAYVAHVMRSIVVDLVRQRRADRRGGDQKRVTLDAEVADSRRHGEEELVRVSDALDELAKVDERLVKVVEMRYYGGMSELEIAEALGVTERTIRRDWEKARMLLASALG